ncbi:hypothetical protein AB3S75_021753 [Citrus x aurantiifolia]
MALSVSSKKTILLFSLVSAIPFACIISLLPPTCTTTAVPAFSVNAPGGVTPTVDSLSPLQREELVWSQYLNLMNDDYSPGTVLDEVTLVKDVDLAGNSSVGIFIDWLRNRLPVAVTGACSL